MKQSLCILLSILLFSACNKDEKQVYVTYKVAENTSVHPTYIVKYTLADGSTKSLGPLTDSKWLSENITGVDIGKHLSLSVEGNGGGSYDLYIYINGALDSKGQSGDGPNAQSLDTTVPD